MNKVLRFLMLSAALFACSAITVFPQTSGAILGEVQDEKQSVIPGATVTLRNVKTNESRTTQSDAAGRYRFNNVPVGDYEITIDASGFGKYVQSGITLALNQTAVVDASMKPGDVQASVSIVENASLLNTTTAEVGVRFDSRRVSELPLATNRNVYNIALSAAGVTQLGTGQTAFAGGAVGGTSGVSYSANGGRIRSNNFMIDGQDNNDFGVAGASVPLNNPDLIQEVRLLTNQFTAEYGRNGSSVFNAITKSGGNEYHGSGFWFYNGNALNACSNTNKAAGFCNPNAIDPSLRKSPFRVENQVGGTIGGPLHLPSFGEGGRSYIDGKDRTFFFFSVQRWYDRQLGTGATLRGAPTEAGRQVLQSAVGNRPQVAALLRFLPAAQTPIGTSATFVANGQTFSVPLGSLTGATSFSFDDWQTSFRVDHRLNEKHSLNGRYIYQDGDTNGIGSQVTPPGFSSKQVARNQGVNLALTSVLTPKLVNEWRGAYLRAASNTQALDPSAEDIPSIEITELGLVGFNAATDRTGIGLGVNLPQFSFRNTYQMQDNISYTTGGHAFKFGFDIRRNQLKQLFKPTTRGRLQYSSLNRFVNDVAQSSTINKDLQGVAEVLHLDWHDFFFYGQDEWKIRPNFTLTYGLRYEIPGQPIQDLVDFNAPVLAAAGNDPRFRVGPIPDRDINNLQPRIGFNWNLRTDSDGIVGFVTGGDKLVLRGGYARTHDYTYTNIALNIWSAFPFVAAFISPTAPITLPGETASSNGVTSAFANLNNPPIDPNAFARTVVSEDFDSPTYDSYSFEVQREFSRDVILRVGYVGSKGTRLFQTLDGNPRLPFSTVRVDPTRNVIRLRANSGSSIYHSMQVSLDKRLSSNFSAGVYYTWSSFIDDASEIFNPSSGEVAVSQDSFNRRADRARSTYDRPHRFSGNFVYELPYFNDQKGFLGHILGGWQVNSFFTFQSGAPFTVLNGSDPTGALSGIAGLVGDAIRPNVITDLPISQMSIEELFGQRATLFRALRGAAFGERVGNAGRNILRADGINNIDFGLVKNTRLGENQRLQLRADFFNATNTRNFGIPDGRAFSTSGAPNAAFLNQWSTNGGNRRVVVGLRYVF
ncbi:MAG TPA: carboxypeptidase regulatory-like domain-containing protein [Pyrinomonadaceae bacterium]|jgi:hypothetical protein